VRDVLEVIGARGVRRRLYGARVIGSDFDWEWGDWNPRVPADRWLLRQWAGLTTKSACRVTASRPNYQRLSTEPVDNSRF